jgi:hypothetical protein
MTLRSACLLGALVAMGFAGQSAASPAPKAVIELFTSQGCSSCPPADQLVGELASQPDVIALSLPVDYWDYLGWKDTLAQPAFTARQRAYASGRGDKQVYTPQVIINGSKPIIGSDRERIEAVIAKLRDSGALAVPVSVSEANGAAMVEVGAVATEAPAAEVWLLPVVKTREVAIGRGENKGRTITYVNVVRNVVKLGDWSGQPARFDVPLAIARSGDAEAYVVLLQVSDEAKPRMILGAAKGPGF